MSAIVTTEITDDERDDLRCLASGVLLAAHGLVKRTANRVPHRVIVADHDHPAPAPRAISSPQSESARFSPTRMSRG